MSQWSESARAKVNLTLEVLGRRSDGFHELNSLVAFAGIGDEVALARSDGFSLDISGPFATELSNGNNIVADAVRLAGERQSDLAQAHVVLTKNLPVAAGLGGGSADAAAVLRLICRAVPGALGHDECMDLAGKLGSDVPVCLESNAALMQGRGEVLKPVRSFPLLDCVLVNPGVPLNAAAVYAELGAAPLVAEDEPSASPVFQNRDELLDFIASCRNDLEVPALKLAPVIGQVLEILSLQKSCELARMSGSGPTCFALFPSADAATQAANAIRNEQPEWWVRETTLS